MPIWLDNDVKNVYIVSPINSRKAVKKVLLVEDEPGLGRVMRRLLERAGYVVLVATTLAEARAHIADPAVRWVLCDTNLPDGSGNELHREWSTTGRLQEITFLAMSASWLVNTAAYHYYHGVAVPMLDKPFDDFNKEVIQRLK